MKLILIAIMVISILCRSVDLQNLTDIIINNGQAYNFTNFMQYIPIFQSVIDDANKSVYQIFIPDDIALGNIGTINSTGLYPSINQVMEYMIALQVPNLGNGDYRSPKYLPSNDNNKTMMKIFYNNPNNFQNNLTTINGVIYETIYTDTMFNFDVSVVKQILYPPIADNLYDTLNKIPNFSNIAAYYNQLDTASKDLLNNTTALTFLAPTNDALSKFDTWLKDRGTNITTVLSNSTVLKNFFLLHTINGSIFTSVLPSFNSTFASFQGTDITFNSLRLFPGIFTPSIDIKDIYYKSGVIQGIGNVLLNSTILPTSNVLVTCTKDNDCSLGQACKSTAFGDICSTDVICGPTKKNLKELALNTKNIEKKISTCASDGILSIDSFSDYLLSNSSYSFSSGSLSITASMCKVSNPIDFSVLCKKV
eukprot:TRINITY_DN3294_c0_g1_i1.p1 TRINITY_DN3294_c0_g1~~TRINITY_DN3294_c0_g1_i1.p1  ORF type:complete len:422 (+),score=57.70 TRINITY_DN3294_c0_g1_i1:49-1314(+)